MDLTDVIGRFGPWQRRILCVLLYRAVPATFVVYNVQFMAPEIDHWCGRDPASDVGVDEWRSFYIPKDNKCEKYVFNPDGSNSNITVKCGHWEFDGLFNDTSNIRKEWNLVCDRSWLVSFSYTAFILGSLLSYIPAGHISDRYGRRFVSIIGMTSLFAFGAAGYFSPNIEFFLAVRIGVGFSYGLCQASTLCLFLEAVGPEYRILMSLGFLGTWGLGMMLLPGLALLANDWRILQLITFVPFCTISPLLIWKFVPESPRWLLTVGRYEEAEEIIVDAAKMNGIQIVDSASVMQALITKISEDKKKKFERETATLFDLFRTNRMRKITLLLYLSIALTVFIYYGFTLTVGNLGGSLHLNFSIMGLTEILSTGIFLLMAKYMPRRKALLTNFFLSGLSFFLTVAVPDDMMWLHISIAIIGFVFNSLGYTFLRLVEAEIFPTNLRTIGVNGGMCAARAGSILGTFVYEFSRITGKKITILIFGSSTFVTSVLFLFLPETQNKHLPDTIRQSERLTSKKHLQSEQ